MVCRTVSNKLGFFSFFFVFLALIAGGLCYGIANLGAFLSAPASEPQKADLIVALGGDGGYRLLKAAELYQNGFANRVLVTGIEASPPEATNVYVNWRTMLLAKKGVPKDAVIHDVTSLNSWDEAQTTRKLMEDNRWKTVLVISDPPHMRRLSWSWGKAFDRSGLKFILIASAGDWWQPAFWWRSEMSAKFVAQEVVKLGYYLIAK